MGVETAEQIDRGVTRDCERESQDIRRKGYADSSRERVPHLSSVSAPIRNFEGRGIAAGCTTQELTA